MSHWHLLIIHVIVMAHLLERRRSIITDHAQTAVANRSLQFTAGVNNRLLLRLLLKRYRSILLWRWLRSLLWTHHIPHLTRGAVWSRVARWLHVLIVVAHSIVGRIAREWRHTGLIVMGLCVVMHLSIHVTASWIVAVHIGAHVGICKVWRHTLTIICTHRHVWRLQMFFFVFRCSWLN